mmetsp:Transcript_44473/g.117493  ORF Transcript_44473/g.117493 Transcript_44473/m.117493 type:complete len:207 (-) Transcript_44473:354-974(-)
MRGPFHAQRNHPHTAHHATRARMRRRIRSSTCTAQDACAQRRMQRHTRCMVHRPPRISHSRHANSTCHPAFACHGPCRNLPPRAPTALCTWAGSHTHSHRSYCLRCNSSTRNLAAHDRTLFPQSARPPRATRLYTSAACHAPVHGVRSSARAPLTACGQRSAAPSARHRFGALARAPSSSTEPRVHLVLCCMRRARERGAGAWRAQ